MVIANFGITTKAVNAVCIGFRASVVGLTAVTRVMQAAFTGATIGATTLKVAIKSLLISTGVGVAVWALTEAISYLATSSDKAAGSTKQLTAEEAARQQEAQQRAEISAAIDINIAKLKAFKGSKEEEKKLVGEMNNTYGDAMGYYSTVAQWYTALVGNSKAYCNQMINEIRIRDLANKAADLQQKAQDPTGCNRASGRGGRQDYSTVCGCGGQGIKRLRESQRQGYRPLPKGASREKTNGKSGKGKYQNHIQAV